MFSQKADAANFYGAYYNREIRVNNMDSKIDIAFLYLSNINVIYSSGRALKRKIEFLFRTEGP